MLTAEQAEKLMTKSLHAMHVIKLFSLFGKSRSILGVRGAVGVFEPPALLPGRAGFWRWTDSRFQRENKQTC